MLVFGSSASLSSSLSSRGHFRVLSATEKQRTMKDNVQILTVSGRLTRDDPRDERKVSTKFFSTNDPTPPRSRYNPSCKRWIKGSRSAVLTPSFLPIILYYIMSSAAQTLKGVLDELEIRQHVESCVKEMVTDVEYAHSLSAQLQHELERQAWEQQNKAQQQALQESYMERQKLKQECLPLADGLVHDLYKTSRELGKYYQLQTKHSTLAQEYDELLAKLLQAEDQIRFLEEEKQQAFRNEPRAEPGTAATVTTPVAVAAPPAEEFKQEAKPTVEEVGPPELERVAHAQTELPAELAQPTAVTTTEIPPSTEEEVEPAAPQTLEEVPEPPPAAVVSLEDEPSERTERHRIEDFEDAILMNIFGFLDALEILNTAQINTNMYNRVDSLFGLGDNGTDNTTIATDEGSMTGTAANTATATTAVTSSSSFTATVAADDTRKPRSNSTGTNLLEPSTPLTPVRGSPTSLLTSSTQQQASAVMSNVFQMFQPRRGAGGGTATPTRRGGGASAPIMNAATASSVAAKLTDSELNAILGMMERMRQKEAAVERLKAENEQLRAEFEGTQSVKDFLVQKVRDMEESLTNQEENETKVAQQIASDQEVIAFLDARVQELERQVSKLQKSQAELDADRQKLKANLEQKSTVLQDMLQFERERFVEVEKEAKSTKKVLVKEIKLCRNQIVALSAENNAYKEQNQTLQKLTGGGGLGERIYT